MSMNEQRLARIEEWIGTPETFLLVRMGSLEEQQVHERAVSDALKELVAEVRALQVELHEKRRDDILDYLFAD
jgi:hypothetical protein